MVKYPVDRVVAYYKEKCEYDYLWEREANLLNRCIECCKMLGALVIREAFATEQGNSDLIICYNGCFYAAELKDATGVPSAQQLRFIDKVINAGGRAAVVRTIEDLIELLTQ